MTKFVHDDAEIHLTTLDLQHALEYWLNNRVVGDRVSVTHIRLVPHARYTARISIKCIEPTKPIALEKKATG